MFRLADERRECELEQEVKKRRSGQDVSCRSSGGVSLLSSASEKGLTWEHGPGTLCKLLSSQSFSERLECPKKAFRKIPFLFPKECLVRCVFAQAFCSQKSCREISLYYAKSTLNYAK